MTPKQMFVYTEEVYIHAQLALSNYTTFQNIINDPAARQSREAWMFLQSFYRILAWSLNYCMRQAQGEKYLVIELEV